MEWEALFVDEVPTAADGDGRRCDEESEFGGGANAGGSATGGGTISGGYNDSVDNILEGEQNGRTHYLIHGRLQ